MENSDGVSDEWEGSDVSDEEAELCRALSGPTASLQAAAEKMSLTLTVDGKLSREHSTEI